MSWFESSNDTYISQEAVEDIKTYTIDAVDNVIDRYDFLANQSFIMSVNELIHQELSALSIEELANLLINKLETDADFPEFKKQFKVLLKTTRNNKKMALLSWFSGLLK